MAKVLLWIPAWLAVFLFPDQLSARTFLVDFGNSSSYRGVSTPSPDGNGNHWNSFGGAPLPATALALKDTSNNTTSVSMALVTIASVGTDSYNGPAGGIASTPNATQIAATDIDMAALNWLGVKEAALDYLSANNGRLVFSGLSPNATYQFTLYGSHKYSSDAATVYEVYRDAGLSQLAGSATLNIQNPTNGALHNRNQVAVIGNLQPSSGGNLYLRFRGQNGGDGYLNALALADSAISTNTTTFLGSTPSYFRIQNPATGQFLEVGADGTLRTTTTDPGSQFSGQWHTQTTTNVAFTWFVNRATGLALQAPVGTGTATLSVADPAEARQALVQEPEVGGSLRLLDGTSTYALTAGASGTSPNFATRDTNSSSQLWLSMPLANGMQIPWTSYDEDNCQPLPAGASKVTSAYHQGVASIAAEAQKRGCILLNSSGAAVRWTAISPGNVLTMRYSVTDGSSGTVTLKVSSTNGVALYSNKVSVTSAQAWTYFDSQMNESDSAGPGLTPYKRYNEARIRLGSTFPAGSILELSRNTGDNLPVWIDVLETESSSAMIPTNLPTAYLSVTSSPYNANGNDGLDDTPAFNTCIAAALAAGKAVYIPAGTYRLNSQLILNPGTTLQGAGMWHTELLFTATGSEEAGGIEGRGANIKLRDFYLKGSQSMRDGVGYKAIKGWFGSGSLIENIWAEQTTCGIWMGWYSASANYTTGTTIRNCRFRNTFADGINLAHGSQYSTVENCHIRGVGDDGIASWSSGRSGGWPQCQSLIFRYNTIECVYRAGGIGFFGGQGHLAYNNLIRDQVAGPGIRLNTVFHQDAHPFGPAKIQIYNNTLERVGSTGGWSEPCGAIDLQTWYADLQHLDLHDNSIDTTQYAALRFSKLGTLTGMDFIDISVTGNQTTNVPLGIRIDAGSSGSAEVDAILLSTGVANSAGSAFVLSQALAQPPTLTSFTPASAGPGDPVILTGTSLSSPTALTIGGVSVPLGSVTTLSDSSLRVVVPPGAMSGTIRVTTQGGSTTSSSSLTVLVVNTAPVVSVGSFPSIALPAGTGLVLRSTFTDDGLPSGNTAQRLWSIVSSPAGSQPRLESASAANTAAIFDLPGSYLLSHTVSDGVLSGSAELVVDYGVNPVQSGGNIGSVGLGGTHRQTNGVWTLEASGADFWQAADAGYFFSAPLSGDGSIQARFLSQDNTDPWAKVGLMIRNSTNANATHTFLAVTPANGLALQNRPATAGNTLHTAAGSYSFPVWLKLERAGTNITGYRSSDGTNWTLLGTATPGLSSNALIGVAMTSHNNAALGSATFDHLSGSGFPGKVALEVLAGSNRTVSLGATTSLSGSVLSGGQALSGPQPAFSWSQISGPAPLSLSDSNNASSSFLPSATGNYQLRLTADDGTLQTFGHLDISITSPFSSWQNLHFPANPAGDQAAMTADPDGDGWINLFEFAQGGDPNVADRAGLGLQISTHALSTNGPAFSFRRRSGSGTGTTESGYTVDGITYTLKASPTLTSANWQTGPSLIQQVGVPSNHGDGTETVTVRLLGTNSSSFLKMEVSSP